MKIKSYFADTIEEAMDKARVELGPDAMLMNSHRSSPEAKHLGAYEVVFALDHATPVHRMRAAVEKHMAEKPSAPANNDALATELAELRRQIEGVKQSVTRQTVHLRWSHGASAEATEMFSRLVEAGFTDDMAQDLVREVQLRAEGVPAPAEWSETPLAFSRTTPSSLDGLSSVLEQELRRRVRISDGLRRDNGGRSVAMVVGAPGSGKTATVAKLAVKHGVQGSRPIHLVCLDSWRVGAHEVLRSYAAILGVSFEVVDSMPALAQALQHRHKTILIDTPGFSEQDADAAADLAHFCENQSELEVHLTLPAHARGAVLARTMDRFRRFRLSGLIATFLDEADLVGNVLEQAIRTNVPFSFLAAGQQVPEDIQPATHEPLLSRVLDLFPQRMLSVA